MRRQSAITNFKHLARSAVHKLGYTIVPNDRVERAWQIDVNVSDMQADVAFSDIYARAQPFTMTTMSRMYALYKATEYVARCGVAGDMVECGVWRGGSAMLVALALRAFAATDRSIYLYDTFTGMPEPTQHDVNLFGQSARTLLEHSTNESHVWARASLDDVRANLAATDYPANKLRFVEGKVEQTIPGIAPEQIALLRLDTDWYASTAHELEHLYPRLVPGGVLIIDDYGHWQGARKAVDEYVARNNLCILLNRIDYTGRIAVKMARP
ncbi:MAG: TylF/MycF family methyltransferase [Chloroflexota bacterium]|nr:TylF/MycF family methyltransferase [Chloroflexota bacterium]